MPVTLLCAPTTATRDLLLSQLMATRVHLAVVVYDLVGGCPGLRARRRVLVDQVVWEDEEVDLHQDGLACTVRDDAPGALARTARAQPWAEVVLAPPAPVLPRQVVDVGRGCAGGGPVRASGVVTALDAGGLSRCPAELLAAQLQQSDVVALLGVEHVDAAAARLVEALLARVAPTALRVPVGPSGERCTEVVVGAARELPSSAGRAGPPRS